MKRLSVQFVFALSVATISAAASAQDHFDSFMHKASHNSYRRGQPDGAFDITGNDRIPLDEQIARWNCYEVEFDVCVRDMGIGASPRFQVWCRHDCGDPNWHDLGAMLDEMGNSPYVRERFTVINFQVIGDINGNNGVPCCGSWDDIGPNADGCANVDIRLFELVDARFPGEVYSYDEFFQDGSVWPSMEELLKRGKRVAISRNRGCFTNGLTFVRAGPATTIDVPMCSHEDPPLPLYQNPPSLAGDAFVWRNYPNGEAVQPTPPVRWTFATSNSFNLIATNDLAANYTNANNTLFCPVPLYVDPLNGGQPPWQGTPGTAWNPYISLATAIARINSVVPTPTQAITVKLSAGDHPIGALLHLNRPLRLTADALGGPARLGGN